MKIRNFKKEDLAQVLDLCREVREHHRDFLNGYFTEQDDEMEQMGFLDSLEDDKMVALVAEKSNSIEGYLLAEEKFAPYMVGSKVMHIANFGVKKDTRGMGVGKMLMDRILEICAERGMDEIRLGVFNKNAIAYRFYEKYGFEPFEQRMKIDLKNKI